MVLSERAWRHIRERHPEVSHYKELIKDVLTEPEVILKGGRAERKAIRHISKTHLGPKYLVVIYREENRQKVIITAYFTSDLRKAKGDQFGEHTSEAGKA